MTIRNAINFSRPTQYTVHMTRNYYVGTPHAPKKANNGAFWGTMAATGLLSMLQSLLTTFQPKIQPTAPSPFQYSNYQPGPPPEAPPKPGPVKPPKPGPTPAAEEPKPEELAELTAEIPTYRKEEKPSNYVQVNTIPFGGPWHYAQYYKDENGQKISLSDPAFNEIVKLLQNGDLHEVEGNRKLMVMPNKITIGGKTFTLMNPTERNALNLRGNDGGNDTRYATQTTDSTWDVYEKKPDEQETLIKSGLTEAQANKLIADKKEQAKEAET